MSNLETLINAAWENTALRALSETQNAVSQTIDLLDKGQLRVAQPHGDT